MSKSPHRLPRAPRATVERLLIYSRALLTLQMEGHDVVSSALLATRTFRSAAQIRRDFTYLDLLGTRGKGYSAADVHQQIDQFLGTHASRQVALIGVGNLGSALLRYSGFGKQNFHIVAGFDVDRAKVAKVGCTEKHGTCIHHLRDLPEVVQRTDISLAILAVPAHAAQTALDIAIEAGIRAILNFAPTRLDPPPFAHVRNIDLSNELGVLAYYCGLGSKDSNADVA